jgi:hypothetical protein
MSVSVSKCQKLLVSARPSKPACIRPQSSIVLRQSSIEMLFPNSKLKTKTSKLGVLCQKQRFQIKNAIFTKKPHVISMSFDVVTLSFLCHLMSFACHFMSFACHLRSFEVVSRPPNETMKTRNIRPQSSFVNRQLKHGRPMKSLKPEVNNRLRLIQTSPNSPP